MFASYITSAIRALQRDPWHAVNIAGLAVALAAGLLIALYVQRELSYENFITGPDRVYRVEADYIVPGRPLGPRYLTTPYPVGEVLRSDLGEQVTATRLGQRGAVVETDRGVIRRTIYVGDQRLFEVLDLAVAEGDGAAAMAEPGALLLSRRTAAELLGAEAASLALGRSLRVDGVDMHVAAILEDPPANTDRPVDILGSIATPALDANPFVAASWGIPIFETFVRANDAMQAEAIAAALPGVVSRHKPADLPVDIALSLRPLRETHLAASPSGRASNQNVIAIAALAATGAFLIFIACFSYINLATARSLLRLKEVGLRKIMGGRASQLALQFLTESALVTLIAFALAVVAAAAALPVFGNLVGRSFSLADLAQPGFLVSAAGLLAFVALAAGAYPALALAGRKPVDLVRQRRSSGGKMLRTGIVSLQFGMTSALMIAAAVAFAQLTFLRNMDVGFDKDGLLVITMTPDQAADGRGQVLRDQLEQSPAFAGVTWSRAAPGSGYTDTIPLSRPGDAPDAVQAVFDVTVGSEFFEVYGVSLLAGRTLSDDLDIDRAPPAQTDGQAAGQPIVRNVVLSETAIRALGFRSPQEAVGQELRSALGNGRLYALTVVGVVSDFHFHLGRQVRMPAVFYPRSLADGDAGEITARVRPGAEGEAVAQAQAIWSQLVPGETLRYQFMEDRIDQSNADDDRQSQLFAFFAGLALFVASLGLFALASFVAARRTFEVAVRKVLGASTLGVTRLLMWDFANPVLLANVIAWPLAYAMVSPWLERFPYRIEISPTYFVGVSALSLAVAMLTILIRTWKTARTRPALVLRTE